MKKLPRELWLIILEIKTRRAINERIKKLLKFPKFLHKFSHKYVYNNSDVYRISYVYACGGRLRWYVSGRTSQHEDDHLQDVDKGMHLESLD